MGAEGGPMADAPAGVDSDDACQIDIAVEVEADLAGIEACASDSSTDAQASELGAVADASPDGSTGIDMVGGPEAATDGNSGPSFCSETHTPVRVTIENPADEVVVGTAYGDSPDDVWVATLPDHKVVRWDGTRWTSVIELEGASILAIAGSGPSDVWLGGTGGVLWHWDGKSFATANSNTTFNITKISMLANGQGFALAVNADRFDLLRLVGTEWSLVGQPSKPSDGLLGDRPFDLYAPTPGEAWVVLSGRDLQGQVSHYRDGSFVTMDVYYVGGVGGTSSDNVWFGGAMWNGRDVVTAFDQTYWPCPIWGTGSTDMWIGSVHWDGGATKDYSYRGLGTDVTFLRGLSTSDVWATSQYGRVAHFDGSNWSEVFPAGSDQVSLARGLSQGIWPIGTSALWIAGSYNQIYLYDGGSLVPIPNTGASPKEDLYGVGGSSTTDLWAVGAKGTILHGDGARWVPSKSPVSTTLSSVSAVSVSDAWAVGYAGTVIHWDGTAWTVEVSNTTDSLYAVWSEAGYVVAVGGSGTIIANEGKGFVVQASGTTSPLVGVWGRDRSHVYAVGGKTLFTYDGSAWTAGNVASDTCVAGVWGTGDGVFANGYYYDETQARRVVPTYTRAGTHSDVICMQLSGVWAGSATDLWGVGGLYLAMGPVRDAPIYHFNGDCTETVSPSPQTFLYITIHTAMRAIFGLGQHDLWAVGDLGLIAHITR
jgi:hypothetical protein